MPQISRLLPAALLVLAFVGACETAPVTGRRQLVLLPESQAQQLGVESYRQILSESRISQDPELNRRVQEVGRRVAAASGHPEYAWEFTVIEDDTPNAFALPGGKVGVHTGLFKVAQDDAQLAAVMAHEVGHAIARHSNERISQQLLLQTGLSALSGSGAVGAQYVQLAAQAATLGVVLPFSRDQESEADHIGLITMAKAGYDPRAAITLWQNFETYGGGRPPEFLSTHPSPGTRIQRLQQLMPEALAIYQRGGGS